MPAIRIRVGASLDANAASVFVPLIAAAKAARQKIQEELAAAGKAIPVRVAQGNRAAAASFRSTADAAEKAYSKMARDHERSVRARERAEAQLARKTQAGIDATATKERRAHEVYGKRVGHWSIRNFSPVTPTLSMGARMGHDLLRGMGIETGISHLMKSYVDAQSIATKISNSGYIEPTSKQKAGLEPMGPNNKRVSASTIMADVQRSANAGAFSREDVGEGLREFINITGDLAQGREQLDDIARVARITGSSFMDVAKATADMSVKLGEVPDKGKKLHDMLLVLAGVGKAGGAEFFDFAKEMPRIAASAGQFSGDRSENMVALTGMLQAARQTGAARNVREAGTSVQAFGALFNKKARLGQFEHITGKSAFGAQGLGGPEALLLTMLQGAGSAASKAGGLHTVGGERAFNAAMSNITGGIQARRMTMAFEQKYRAAGGGDKGLAAVHGEMERLGREAKMSEQEANYALSTALQTAEAKAQLFQNQLQQIADKVASKLIPALEELAPRALKLAESFGNLLTWFATNPGEAIAVALAASVAKAGIEQALRGGIEKMFSAHGTSGFMKGSSIGNLGTIAALAVTSAYIGMAIIDYFDTKDKAEERAKLANNMDASTLMSDLSSKATHGKLTPKDMEAASAAIEKLEAQLQQQKLDEVQGPGSVIFGAVAETAGLTDVVEAQDRNALEQKRKIELTNRSIEELKHIMELIKNSGIPITNLPGQGLNPEKGIGGYSPSLGFSDAG